MSIHPLFEKTSLDYLPYLLIKDYPKNQLIENEGDYCERLGLVLEGSITISTLSPSDKEYIIKKLGKGSFFGEILLFSRDKRFLGDIISNGAKVAFISKTNLMILLKDQIILENYLSLFSQEMTDMQMKLKILSQKNLRDRLLFYFVLITKQNNCQTITIKSKEDLAAYLNIPRPSLSRELSLLKKEKIIDYNRHQITLL